MGCMKGAEEYDIVLNTDAIDRLEHSLDLAKDLTGGSIAEVLKLGLLSRGALSGFGHVVTFAAVVPGPVEPIMKKWKFRLGDYLFNARAILDHLMWVAAHDDPTSPIAAQDEKDLQFPICETEQQWKSFAGTATAKKIRKPLLDRIHALQPYQRLDHPTSRGMLFMQRIHRYDKHRLPLKLTLKLDMQMLPLFGAWAESGDYDDEWLEFDQAIRDGLPLLRRRFVNRTVQPADERLNVAAMANFEGQDYDLQDLIWDVTAALYRAIDGVSIGTTLRADVYERDVAWRRESLEALRRSILYGTDEWRKDGFDKPSPWARLVAEINKAEPDLSAWVRSEGPPEDEIGMPLVPK